MTNELQIFSYEGNEVRTVEINGETWFVLKDVCNVLGLSNSRMVADRLDDDEKDIFKSKPDLLLDAPNRGLIIVNESGLYNVILRSDKPEAKKFKRWITHEVLPSIRKTGLYATPETARKILENPDFLIEALRELKAARAGNEELKVKLNESEKFWTIMKFNQHFNLRWNMKTCQTNGKAASAYSRQHGYEVRKCKTNDDRFEFTNSYAYEVLERLFLPVKALA